MIAKSTLLYISLAVSNSDEAAKNFAKRGFTLKKPHHYKEGLQKGIVTQSILFKDGSSLQLLSVKEKQSPLANWYQNFLKEGDAGGTQVVLQNPSLTRIADNLKSWTKEFKFEEHSSYSWLSFKTQSDYAHIAFLKWKKAPSFIDELYQHPNLTEGIKKVILRPVGDPLIWAKIMKSTYSIESALDFGGLFSTGSAFVEKIILNTRKKPLPSPFKVGSTQVEFHSL